MSLESIRRGVMMMISLSREFLTELEPGLSYLYNTQLDDLEWALDVAYLDNNRDQALDILRNVDAFSEKLLVDLRKVAA